MKTLGVILLIIGIILAVWQVVVVAYGGLFWLGVALVIVGIILASMRKK